MKDICFVCKEEIKEYVYDEFDGSLRKDTLGNLWCRKCVDIFENIDWDEVNESKLGGGIG
jgi:hypothetical protein